MAILRIEKFNASVLRKKCTEVEKITPEIKRLVFDMIETMKEGRATIGLAAPQVGISKRVIAVQFDPRGSKVIGLINPKITKRSSETDVQEEGCLSFPGIYLSVRRAKEVEVEALDIDGEEIKIKAEGLGAEVLQHEIDHLDGILFFNRLSFFQQLKFKLKHPLIRLWL